MASFREALRLRPDSIHTRPWPSSREEAMEPRGLERHRDGGVSLNNPIHLPSMTRLHQWGAQNLGALAAPPPFPPPRHAPAVEGMRTQRSVSLAFPLCGMPDEIVKAPAVWPRAVPNERVLKYLTGPGAESPRLLPFDRTVNQPVQDVTKATSYTTHYCRPAALRTQTLPPLPKRVPVPQQQSAALNWVEDDERNDAEIERAARFGIKSTIKLPPTNTQPFGRVGVAALDDGYDVSRHGHRAVMPPRGHVFNK